VAARFKHPPPPERSGQRLHQCGVRSRRHSDRGAVQR
jgi:hypothetical protein